MTARSTAVLRREAVIGWTIRRSPLQRRAGLATIAADKGVFHAADIAAGEGLAREFGRGAVDPATGVLTFGITEGYRIRHGRIAEPLRGVRVSGCGPDLLAGIDRVGNDVELTPLVCTKDGQKAMVSAGASTIRVTAASIGGR